MSVYDKRLDALEKDAAVIKRDIIYKLDDTNSAVGMLKGIIGSQGRDIKFLINQVKGVDIRLEGLDQEVRTIKEQQNVQGQDIKDITRRLDVFDNKLDQILQLLGSQPRTGK
ncbi:hypothetical protein ccbrp13_48350 [Ktedonobacteria bacterium brp13]|nr:hypothetical protein ccbrp13_48350 [Ktedonobacteria bacterium brp13]